MSKSGILGDHKRVKRKLIPPLLAVFGDAYSPYSWANEIVPEIFWISLLLKKFGVKKGTEIALRFIELTREISIENNHLPFIFISNYMAISSKDRENIASKINDTLLENLSYGLEKLNEICEDHALKFILSNCQPAASSHINDAKLILAELYDRYSSLSTFSMASVQYIGMRIGKVRHTNDLFKKRMQDFKEIEHYPNTEESKMAGASFRASIPMFLLANDNTVKSFHAEWLEYFWESISMFGDCSTDFKIEYEEIQADDDPLENIIIRYRNSVKHDFNVRIENWKLNLNEIEVYEVVGALFSRQAILSLEIAGSPNIWTPHSGPLFLRSMADVYIILAWILKDPINRAKKFVDDGLSANKLQLAHRKKELETCDNDFDRKNLSKIIQYLESWIASQRIVDLIEVNLGSWSGLNTRNMALEAGCIDFYNYVYQPFSQAVHSNWAHISEKNMVYCDNPAHRYHKIPTIIEIEPDFYYLKLAAKYFGKTLKLWDEFTSFTGSKINSYDLLLNIIEDIDNKETV